MKIRLEAEGHNAEIEVLCDDLDINDVWQDLIRPALLAFGYQEKTVDSLTNETNLEETSE